MQPRITPTDILIEDDCRILLSLLPPHTFRCLKLHDEVFACYVELEADRFCPNGLFSTSAAVDVTPQAAIRRATYEACERYFLGSIRLRESEFKDSETIVGEVYRSPWSLPYPFIGDGEGKQVICTEDLPFLVSEYAYVATGDVFAPYPIGRRHSQLVPSTNGVAVHKSMADAAIKAFHEVVERDAVMRFWYTSARNLASSIFCSSSGHPNSSHAYLQCLGYQVLVFKLHTDNCVNVVFAFAVHETEEFPYSACAAGASARIEDAYASALLELIQTVVSLGASSDRVRTWLRCAMPMTTLDHNMFWYSIRALAGPAITSLRYIHEGLPVAPCASERAIEGGVSAGLCAGGISLVRITPELVDDELAGCKLLSTRHYPLVIGDALGPKELLESSDRLQFPHPFP